MILLMGSSKDDILYFDTIIKNRVVHKQQFKRFPITQGTIFNQNVVITYGAYTSYMTSALVESLINKYDPLIVILLGKCKALTDDLKIGDIAVSDTIIPLDVNQSEYCNVKIGQIPGIDREYRTSLDVLHILQGCFDKFLINNAYNCTFMTSNRIFDSKNELNVYSDDNLILGYNRRLVLESEAYGAIIPCIFHEVPFVSIKAVDCEIGKRTEIDNFIKTLDTYSKIGKAVVSFIGEIGRRDLKE